MYERFTPKKVEKVEIEKVEIEEIVGKKKEGTYKTMADRQKMR